MTLTTPLAEASGGTGAASKKLAGIAYGLASSYVSGTGTAGADNTAQTVKTIAIPAGTMTQVGDRLVLKATTRPDTGSAITTTVTVNGVTVVAYGSGTGTAGQFVDLELQYVDSTHANLVAFNSITFNVAGFDWTASQNIEVKQNAIIDNRIVVFSIVGTVVPKGV